MVLEVVRQGGWTALTVAKATLIGESEKKLYTARDPLTVKTGIEAA
jgi:hypothetical protein